MVNVEAVKVGVGLVSKAVAGKGIDIAMKSSTKGLTANAQKFCVWAGRLVATKVVGDCAYNEVTGRNFNKDANEFLKTHLTKVKKDCENAAKNEKEVQAAKA